jgi:hypothetical protein
MARLTARRLRRIRRRSDIVISHWPGGPGSTIPGGRNRGIVSARRSSASARSRKYVSARSRSGPARSLPAVTSTPDR